MNNNIDVIKELEVKNREIYLNKLNIDLDNNNEILHITINNIINLFCEEVTNKIIELKKSDINIEEIRNIINVFYHKIKEELELLLNNRYKVLKDNIINIENINYKENINKEKEIILNNIKNIYEKLVKKLIIENNNDRIDNYLKVLNYERFITKIKEILNNMDIILYNSYVESNNKYKELNQKTLNK